MDLAKYSRQFTRLRFEQIDGVILKVIISNPGKMNATDHGLHKNLADVWAQIDTDPDIRVALVTGEGDTFSAGGDYDFMESTVTDPLVRLQVLREAKDLVYNIINCSKPIVSAVRDAAVGAGLVVAVLSDVSVVSKTARLIDGHTRLGLAAGDHAAIAWPLLMGMAKAKYYLLTCEPLSGERADELGLVSMSVPDADVLDKAVSVARRLAEGSPTAIGWTKQTLNHWYRSASPAFEASLAYEFVGFTLPDLPEGVAALRGKRPAKFPGLTAEGGYDD